MQYRLEYYGEAIDWEGSDDYIAIACAERLATYLDVARPPWEESPTAELFRNGQQIHVWLPSQTVIEGFENMEAPDAN